MRDNGKGESGTFRRHLVGALRGEGRSQQAHWLRSVGAERSRGFAFPIVAIALLLAITPLMPNVWRRMALFYAITIPVALFGIKLEWAELLRPGLGKLASGAFAAIVLYALAGAGFRLVVAVAPPLAAQAGQLYAWKGQVSATTAALLSALLIIPGEEIVWRAGVTLPLAGRYGTWAGISLGAVAFAAAHVGFGSTLLLVAALACGTFWGWLTLRTRSLVPPIVCHLAWDLTVLYWLPY